MHPAPGRDSLVLALLAAAVLASPAAHAQVVPSSANEATGALVAAEDAVPLASRMDPLHWWAMVEFLGDGLSHRLVRDYIKVAGPGAAQGKAPYYTFHAFLEDREEPWKVARNTGIGLMVAGGVLAVVGGLVYASPTGELSKAAADEPGVRGMQVLASTMPIAGSLLIVGASLVGVYQTRLNGLEKALNVPSRGSSFRWTGLAPTYDPVHGTAGAAASFTF